MDFELEFEQKQKKIKEEFFLSEVKNYDDEQTPKMKDGGVYL